MVAKKIWQIDKILLFMPTSGFEMAGSLFWL